MPAKTAGLSVRRVATICDQGYYGDGGGLYLRVTETGTKAWIFRYQIAGRRRDMGLGKVDLVSLAEARRKAEDARKLVACGQDPLDTKIEKSAAAAVEAAKALRFAILTAARTNEALGATWAEIDLAGRLWTVPAERMKAGKEHRVPLSDPVMALLCDLYEGRQGGPVFPGAIKGKGLSNMALLMTLRRFGRADLTTHGFRSTFRDWVSEQTNVPSEVAEMALAHAVGDKVEAWGAFCSHHTASDVVPSRTGA
jgi:integrase